MTAPQARSTLKVDRRILVVVRNPTSLDRLMDVLRGLGFGVVASIKFVIDRGSEFSRDLRDHLRNRGCHVLSWRQAKAIRFDAIVAAHATPHLHELRGPLLTLPHGVGYPRLVPFATNDTVSPTGLARSQLVHEGVVVPTVIGLSHEEQLARLAVTCAEAVERAVVIGDPVMDRIDASRRLRTRYRELLGIAPDQVLVVVSSTWGRYSTLGVAPYLPHQLLAQLPSDDYKVALVQHWNIQQGHSWLEIVQHLRDAEEGGLIVVPPQTSWQAVLIAADIVVGDHGSVTFYGAALGTPVLLVSDGGPDVDPTSPNARLWAATDRLNPDLDLRPQIRSAIRCHDPVRLTRITSQALGRPGQSWRILHDTLRGLMGLPAAQAPRIGRVPDPDLPRTPFVGAYRVTARLTVRGDGCGCVDLERYPDVLHPYRPRPDGEPFLVADVHREVDQTCLTNAEVLVNDEQLSDQDCLVWLKEALADHPGAAAVAARTGAGCVVSFRGGTQFTVNHHSPGLVASALYCWVAAGAPVSSPIRLTVRLGAELTELAA